MAPRQVTEWSEHRDPEEMPSPKPGRETTEIPRLVEWGVATATLAGESESGDMHLVKPFPSGVLLAAVDGLGHGDEAALAAKAAVDILERNAQSSVISLIQRCHEELRTTRGVVMSLASLNALEGTISWLGVGNVEGVLLRADAEVTPSREVVLLRGGVLGYSLPPLHAEVMPIMKGDTLVFATDGIRSDFIQDLQVEGVPQRVADRICARHKKGTDDALVLVARYLGG